MTDEFGRNCNACNEAQRRVPNFLAFSRSRLSAEFQTVPLPKIRTNTKAGHLSSIFVSRPAHAVFFSARSAMFVFIHSLYGLPAVITPVSMQTASARGKNGVEGEAITRRLDRAWRPRPLRSRRCSHQRRDCRVVRIRRQFPMTS